MADAIRVGTRASALALGNGTRGNAPALRIGTRGSALALWQANHTRALLARAHPGLDVEIVEIRTEGDRVRDVPLAAVGGVGLFTKEIERALLDGEVDVAVHSLKDLPTELAAGLALGAVPSREDVRDAVVGKPLGPGVTVGTGSPRRRGQLLAAYPGIRVEGIRGNVPTRVDRTEAEDGPDSVVLALAGLLRLGLEDRVAEVLPLRTMLPAPGQGALGIEVRADDERARALVAPLEDPEARAAVAAERAFLRRLEGGCTAPVAAYAKATEGQITLRGVVAEPQGGALITGSSDGGVDDPQSLGVSLAEDLLSRGAAEVLDRLRGEA